jgi:tetratricopeptide (TPR) repeat protein
MQTFAHEEAVGHFERALAALDSGPASDRLACELLLALSEARTRCGERTRAREAAVQAAERAGDAPDLLARAALAYGAELVMATVDATLIGLLQRALAAQPPGPGPLRARMMARLGAAMQPAEDPDVPTALAREAIAMARGLGDRSTLARVLRDGRAAYMPLDPLEERMAIDLETLALGYETGDRVAALMALFRLALGRLEEGQVAAALDHLDRFDRLAVDLRQAHDRYQGTLWRAGIATLRGHFTEAERLIEEGAALAATSQAPNARMDVIGQRFALIRAACRDDEGPALVAAATEATAHHALRAGPLFQALVQARLGNRDGLGDARPGLPPIERTERLGGQAYVAELIAASGDARSAAQLYPVLLPWAQRHFLFAGCEGSWSRPLGLLAATMGRWDEARRHFEDAIAANQNIGARPWVAQTQVAYADMLLATGDDRDRARANELQAAARVIAEELGMPGLLARLPARAVTAPTAKAGDDLSGAFRLDGAYWTITHAGQTFRLKDSKGLQLVAHLLRHPGQEMHVLHLSGVTAQGETEQVLVAGDTGPLLDAAARTAYQQRLEELEESLREAESFGDGARATRARE